MKKQDMVKVAIVMIMCIFSLTACGSMGEGKPLSSEELQSKWNVDPQVKKVIVDTDLQYFLDDIFAVNALLQADKLGYLELCGVTVACGNTTVEGAAYDTLAYLDYAGRSDVPVYMGSNELISGFADIDELEKKCGSPGFTGLYRYLDPYIDDYLKAKENGSAKWPGEAPVSKPMEQNAADYIVEEIHQNPGEVTILALGSLTNVAQALQKDPSIVQDAAGIIYMGGVFDIVGEKQKNIEFNFWCDPKASNLVLSAGWKDQVVVSHDAAATCLKGYDVYQKALKHNHNPFISLYISWCQEGCSNDEEIKEKIDNALKYCWDPITVAYMLCREQLCTTIDTRYLWIDDRMGATYGSTFNWHEENHPDESYPAQVVLSVDRDKFWDFMIDLADAQ